MRKRWKESWVFFFLLKLLPVSPCLSGVCVCVIVDAS
jgi:hypothetical protein